MGKSKLEAAFLESGHSPEDLRKALANKKPLLSHEIDLLEMAKIEFEKNRRFFEKAKALLSPSQFIELLHEAKGDEKEGRKPIKNNAARLIHRFTEAIRSAA